MDKLKLVDKLKEKTDISYEEAKEALENNNWDILQAMVYLENLGKIKRPDISEFYTNDYKTTYINESEGAIVNINGFKEENGYKGKNDFHGVFEIICKVIDNGNNIFLEVSRRGSVIFKLPFTVVAVLLFFAFWGIIPLMIIGLFFEIEFLIATKRFPSRIIDKTNKVFEELSAGAKEIKDKIVSNIHSNK